MELPMGPMGLKIPTFLPVKSATRSESDMDRPQAEALKIISGKDLGLNRENWIHWVMEKTGRITYSELKEAHQDRSILSRMFPSEFPSELQKVSIDRQ